MQPPAGMSPLSTEIKHTFFWKSASCFWYSWQPLQPDLDSAGSSGSFSDPSEPCGGVCGVGSQRYSDLVCVSQPPQMPPSVIACLQLRCHVGDITPCKFMSYILESLNITSSALVTLDLSGVSITKCSHILPHPSNRQLNP